MIVRTTNKLRTINKLKHRTFRKLKLKKMKKPRIHNSASSMPSNLKAAIDRKRTRLPPRRSHALAADDQQAEAPSCPQVKIKEDEETPYPQLSKQFAFQPKRGNSYIMLCKLCLPRQTELSAYKN